METPGGVCIFSDQEVTRLTDINRLIPGRRLMFCTRLEAQLCCPPEPHAQPNHRSHNAGFKAYFTVYGA